MTPCLKKELKLIYRLKGCVCLFNVAQLLFTNSSSPWPIHCMFIYNQLARISVSLNTFSIHSLKKALPWGPHGKRCIVTYNRWSLTFSLVHFISVYFISRPFNPFFNSSILSPFWSLCFWIRTRPLVNCHFIFSIFFLSLAASFLIFIVEVTE